MIELNEVMEKYSRADTVFRSKTEALKPQMHPPLRPPQRNQYPRNDAINVNAIEATPPQRQKQQPNQRPQQTPATSQNNKWDHTQNRPNPRDPAKLYSHFCGPGKGHTTKHCAYFAKGKEYQEAQQATASGLPKPVNYTRRQPTPVTTPYHYTPVNYDIPSQYQPQQYLTFANYNPSYHHYNAYNNPQSSFSYNSHSNNQPYTVTHPPTPPQMQNQHLALPPPPPPPPTQPQ
jgi:hypothetical protein